jgi:hypothetical protein
MERCLFEMYDPTSEKILASRQQFPLRLAYAMTVHQAQGQSIQYLDVDCYSFFAPGQMGVVSGRATCTNARNLSNTSIVKSFRNVSYQYYRCSNFKCQYLTGSTTAQKFRSSGVVSFHVVRQNQLQLIQAINELCDGSPTPETEAFLKSHGASVHLAKRFSKFHMRRERSSSSILGHQHIV